MKIPAYSWPAATDAVFPSTAEWLENEVYSEMLGAIAADLTRPNAFSTPHSDSDVLAAAGDSDFSDFSDSNNSLFCDNNNATPITQDTTVLPTSLSTFDESAEVYQFCSQLAAESMDWQLPDHSSAYHELFDPLHNQDLLQSDLLPQEFVLPLEPLQSTPQQDFVVPAPVDSPIGVPIEFPIEVPIEFPVELSTEPTTVEPPVATRKRKHGSSPASSGEDGPANPKRSRATHRACDACRQQKLKCKHPEGDLKCIRCVEKDLECTVEPGFRRVEKRQHAENIEQELANIKRENAELKEALRKTKTSTATNTNGASQLHDLDATALNASEEAASQSLLDLAAQGTDSSEPMLLTLGNVILTQVQITELFEIYFAQFHPFLPLLTDLAPSTYHKSSPLLYWTIITVAARRYSPRPTLLTELRAPLTKLLWTSLGAIPNSYQVVKALCLLCTWPLPTSSTSSDPSIMICGIMCSLATQFGLHRPSHAQDFSRTRIELRDEEINDRINTWVAVNIVAQNVSTGHGVPQLSKWNWHTSGSATGTITPLFRNRCLVEKFVDKVTRTIYNVQRDEAATKADNATRMVYIDNLRQEYSALETLINSQEPTTIDILHLQIAALHLRLTVFFEPPDTERYRADVQETFTAAVALVSTFQDLQQECELFNDTPESNSRYATNYMMQTIMVAGCTLQKLLCAPGVLDQEDLSKGRALFVQTLQAIRSMSVAPNDIPLRVAECLAQLWQASEQTGSTTATKTRPKATRGKPKGRGTSKADHPLQLKVRFRMSMSLAYDTFWRWRTRFGEYRDLDCMVEHPTIPKGCDTPMQSNLAFSPGPSAAPLPNHSQSVNDVLLDPAAIDNVFATSAHDPVGLNVDLNYDDWTAGLGGFDMATAPFDAMSWALDFVPAGKSAHSIGWDDFAQL